MPQEESKRKDGRTDKVDISFKCPFGCELAGELYLDHAVTSGQAAEIRRVIIYQHVQDFHREAE